MMCFVLASNLYVKLIHLFDFSALLALSVCYVAFCIIYGSVIVMGVREYKFVLSSLFILSFS